MGRGSKSPEYNVKKQLETFSSSSLGGGSKSASKDSCMFSFSALLKTNNLYTDGLNTGQSAQLVPSYDLSGKLEIVSGSRVIGVYRGTQEEKIRICLKKGYIYEGSIIKLAKGANETTVSVRLNGEVRK